MTEPIDVAALKNGSEKEFRLLVEHFQNKVFNTVYSFLRNRNEADDVTQEIFIKVFRSIDGFKGQSSLSTWIYRITVAKSLERLRYYKTKKRFAFMTELISGKAGSDSISVDYVHPGLKLENQELATHLLNALEQLPENQKSVFILHKMEGFSYQEIAEVLSLSLSSIESLMFRAKANLRKLLYNYYKTL